MLFYDYDHATWLSSFCLHSELYSFMNILGLLVVEHMIVAFVLYILQFLQYDFLYAMNTWVQCDFQPSGCFQSIGDPQSSPWFNTKSWSSTTGWFEIPKNDLVKLCGWAAVDQENRLSSLIAWVTQGRFPQVSGTFTNTSGGEKTKRNMDTWNRHGINHKTGTYIIYRRSPLVMLVSQSYQVVWFYTFPCWLKHHSSVGLNIAQINHQNWITLLRVIPTMTFIHFVTGKPSGILSDIPSGILSGISSGILSGISSGILAGISSAICSGISSGTLSGISSDILSGKSSGILSGKHSGTLSGIPTGILSDILSVIPSGILSGISSGILSGTSSDILSDISSDILSGISSDILSGISSDILSDILSGILSGISSDILSDIFSHILPVEVRQCPLRSGSRGWGPAVPTAIWKSRLRSGSAHCDLEVAVPTGIWSSRWRSGCAHWDLELAVEVRLCPQGSGLRGGGGGWGGGGGNGGGGGGGEQLW